MTAHELPLANRSLADLPGHWLLARLGKRVLRPGGLELTTRLLSAARINDADVVELGPGLGRTAKDIVRCVRAAMSGSTTPPPRPRRCAPSWPRSTAPSWSPTHPKPVLPDNSVDVVVGEAMLTMQGDENKRAIVEEAFRVLRPGGRYAIHELGLKPDNISQDIKDDIRKALARSIKVNARPLTAAQWTQLLTEAGFEIASVDFADMALLNPKRVIADEGFLGALKIVGNVIRHPSARKRVLGMRQVFQRHRISLAAIAVVGVVPEASDKVTR